MSRRSAELPHYLSADAFYLQVANRIRTVTSMNFALVTLDFDSFNYINDLFSFEVGDRVLRNITEHFSGFLQQGEMFSRLHADHFAFYVCDDDDASLVGRFQTMTDLGALLAQTLPTAYKLVCSGGIVRITAAGESITGLLDRANYARKQAKTNVATSFLLFDATMREVVEWRKTVTLTMELALQNREFEMYLQPKMLMKTGELAGAEALARWNTAEHGVVMPDRFIPILEQNGFVCRLDFFMLEEACRLLRRSEELGIARLPISVNFSKLHVNTPGLVDQIQHTVQKYDIPPHLIEIEFTESTFLDDYHALLEITRALKLLGFRVSLDDFGSAYSSLSHLKELPLDVIKIDREFLNATENSEKGRVIIAKMVELIQSLRMTSVMEGVETAEQSDFLRKLRCDLGQGYYYAKPMPIAQYVAFARADRPAAEQHFAPPPVQNIETLQRSLESKIAEQESIIASERESREALRMSEERYRLLIEQSDDVMFEWDFQNDHIVFSDKFEGLFGRTATDHWGTELASSGYNIHPEDASVFRKWVSDSYCRVASTSADFRVRHADGRYLWIHGRATTLCDADGAPVGAVGVFTDITGQKDELEALTKKAQLDPLTHLYNKEETRRRIETLLRNEPNNPGALFIIDVDNFKGVNDALGHQFGDSVLVEIAQKMQATFREADIVGRIGGDEFAVFVRGLEQGAVLVERAERLIQSVHSTYFGAVSQYFISISVGIACYPTQGASFDALYQLADVALYQSKGDGKDRYTVYRSQMTGLLGSRHTPVEYSDRFLTDYFKNDFTYNVFEMLYETKDLTTSMQKVIELTGKRFQVDRVYIFQNSADGLHTSNTYEWCAAGIPPEIDTLQNLNISDLQHYIDAYGPEGMLSCSDLREMDDFTYETLSRQGIQSFLHCAIYDKGERSGFLGFDVCHEQREWHGEELATLGYLARILSVFLRRDKT